MGRPTRLRVKMLAVSAMEFQISSKMSQSDEGRRRPSEVILTKNQSCASGLGLGSVTSQTVTDTEKSGNGSIEQSCDLRPLYAQRIMSAQTDCASLAFEHRLVALFAAIPSRRMASVLHKYVPIDAPDPLLASDEDVALFSPSSSSSLPTFSLPPVTNPTTFLRSHIDDHVNPNCHIKLAHGTTTLAFRFDGGIVVAVDSRATAGNWIASQTVKKGMLSVLDEGNCSY